MKRILLLFTVFFLAFTVNGQELKNSLLWRISGNGLEAPSYLYGTMHALCEVNLSPATLSSLDETSRLCLEIDMDDPNLQVEMAEGSLMSNDTKISSFCSSKEFQILDRFLNENIGISLKMVDQYKPFLINAMLLPKLLECPIQSVETTLMDITKKSNKDIIGLESISTQLSMFDKIPYKEQIKELIKSASDQLDFQKSETQDLISLYESENIEALEKKIKESENILFRNYSDILLNDRNVSWIPLIEKYAKEAPTFFGVGAAHLAGENGVIKLLQKNGYTVEAIK